MKLVIRFHRAYLKLRALLGLVVLAACGGPAFTIAAADVVDDAGTTITKSEPLDAQIPAETSSPAAELDAGEKQSDAGAADVALLEHDAAADVAGDVVEELAPPHAVACSGNPPAGCSCSPSMVPPTCAPPFSVWCAPMGESLEPECCTVQCN